eukprot:10885-Rhodomonas_salina.2
MGAKQGGNCEREEHVKQLGQRVSQQQRHHPADRRYHQNYSLVAWPSCVSVLVSGTTSPHPQC